MSKQLDEGLLANEEVKEMLRNRICSLGLSLNIDTLYNEAGNFKREKSGLKIQKEHYKKSVEEVRLRRGVTVTSTWTQDDSSQWYDTGSSQSSNAGSSDQGSP